MANYIVTNRRPYFEKIGSYSYKDIDSIILPDKVGVDTETTSLKTFKGEIFAVQVGTGTDNYLFDVESIGIQPVIELLKDRVLIFHNAIFDLGWLYKYGFFPWKVRDTMLASQILHNGKKEIRHGFGYVMERELGLEYDKSEQENIAKIKLSTNKAIQYCFNDVDKLIELDTVLSNKIIAGGYLGTYQLHRRWIRAAAYMEQCGLPINEEKWKEKIRKDREEQAEKIKGVTDYIYNNLPKYRSIQLDMFSTNNKLNIEITSPKQMLNVFKDLGINVLSPDKDEKTGKFKESIAEEVIGKSDHEFVKIWLDYQSITHDVTTFGENFLPSIHEGRLYTKYKPILDTARISAGGKNKIKGEPHDVNTLNIPANEKSRSPFEAKPGFKLIVADFEGQENTIGVDAHQDPVMRDSVLNGSCLHCAFARVLFPEIQNLSDDEIKKNHADKRQASKSPRFLFSYGGGAFTLHTNEGIPMERAIEIEQGYKNLHPAIFKWGEKMLEEALRTGEIVYWGGFRLHLRNFDFFQEKHRWLQSLTRGWWSDYKDGKLQYRAKKKAEEEGKEYKIKNQRTFDLYRKNASDVSKYFQQRAEYLKLCLNATIQGTSAHQTKGAVNYLYEYIHRNNHFWDARIALSLHDEIVCEVKESLTHIYKNQVEHAMIQVGNTFLKDKSLTMRAEAFVHSDWYSAKKGEPL